MSDHGASLGKYVRPAVDDARLARQYAAVSAGLDRAGAGARWKIPAMAFGLVAAGALAVVVGRTQLAATRPPGAMASSMASASALGEGTVFETSATPATVTLREGSELTVGARTRARLTEANPDSIRLELERGTVEIEATHVEGRRFIVASRGYEVRVVGTHFTVKAAEGGGVEVTVARGRVAVTSPNGDARAVGAGERWSVGDLAREPKGAGELNDATDPKAPSPSTSGAHGSSSAASARSGGADAKSLLESAQRARKEGRTLDAAKAYDELRKRFRSDPRAGLAAFELGRLRLDVLRDPLGADEAFRDAIAIAPGGSFREDADARRVEALDRLGDRARCASMRDGYLARYPSGLYRRTVGLYCLRP